MEYFKLNEDGTIERSETFQPSINLSKTKVNIKQDGKTVDTCLISTVFLGLNHGTLTHPLLFETMIFDGPLDGYQKRCFTYNEAVQMHMRAKDAIVEALEDE